MPNESSIISAHRDYERAIKVTTKSRQQVEKLLADVPRDEHYVLSVLGPILVNLKDAQSVLEALKCCFD